MPVTGEAASRKDSREAEEDAPSLRQDDQKKRESDAQKWFARREHATKQRWQTQGRGWGSFLQGKHRRCLLGHRCVQQLEQGSTQRSRCSERLLCGE